jgi:hypothetical protein
MVCFENDDADSVGRGIEQGSGSTTGHVETT